MPPNYGWSIKGHKTNKQQLILFVKKNKGKNKISDNLETMAPTLEDVMNFMMKDKEERAKERESDKQEIKELMTSGVKAEVTAAIQPIQERKLLVENVQVDMVKQFKGM